MAARGKSSSSESLTLQAPAARNELEAAKTGLLTHERALEKFQAELAVAKETYVKDPTEANERAWKAAKEMLRDACDLREAWAERVQRLTKALELAETIDIQAECDVYSASNPGARFVSDSRDDIEEVTSAWATLETVTSRLIERARAYGAIEDELRQRAAKRGIELDSTVAFGGLWTGELRSRLQTSHPVYTFGVPHVGKVCGMAMAEFANIAHRLHPRDVSATNARSDRHNARKLRERVVSEALETGDAPRPIVVNGEVVQVELTPDERRQIEATRARRAKPVHA